MNEDQVIDHTVKYNVNNRFIHFFIIIIPCSLTCVGCNLLFLFLLLCVRKSTLVRIAPILNVPVTSY